jgi:hypothetical protein
MPAKTFAGNNSAGVMVNIKCAGYAGAQANIAEIAFEQIERKIA